MWQNPQFTKDLITFTKEILNGTLSGLRQFLETESPLTMLKNAFYFTLKAFFVLKIFHFILDFFLMYKNDFV